MRKGTIILGIYLYYVAQTSLPVISTIILLFVYKIVTDTSTLIATFVESKLGIIMILFHTTIFPKIKWSPIYARRRVEDLFVHLLVTHTQSYLYHPLCDSSGCT